MIKLKNILLEDETKDPQEIVVDGYQTRHYDMCPGATALYKNIEGKVQDMEMAKAAAKLQDVLFYMEKHTVKVMKSASQEDVIMASTLGGMVMDIAKKIGLEKEHGYIKGHIDAIKGVVNEAPVTGKVPGGHATAPNMNPTVLGMFKGMGQ